MKHHRYRDWQECGERGTLEGLGIALLIALFTMVLFPALIGVVPVVFLFAVSFGAVVLAEKLVGSWITLLLIGLALLAMVAL